MAECKKYSRWIALFAGGDLADEASDRLRAHLVECRECADLVSRYRADRRELRRYARYGREAAATPADESWWAEIRARLEAPTPRGADRARPVGAFVRGVGLSGSRAFALAAALVLLAMGGYWTADHLLGRPMPVDPTAESPSSPAGGDAFVPVGTDRVQYPIKNLTRSFARPGLDPDADRESGSAGSDGAINRGSPVIRLGAPSRSRNY